MTKTSKKTPSLRQPIVTNNRTFILEEILTLSGLVDLEQANQASDADFTDDGLLAAIAADSSMTESLEAFESGTFQVTGNGDIKFDFLFDGGGYKGELGIFSLEGMDAFDPNSSDFIQEAARRVSSGTELGHIVISDPLEGARFSGSFEHEGDFNAGEYLGPKTVTMKPGDRFGLMLVPNGRFQEVLENPDIEGAKRPLFSMATANPEDHFHVGQLADVTGDGNTFVFEDLRVDTGSDEDYNDLVFRVEGARGEAESLDDYINPDNDWRETVMGQEIVEYARSFVEPDEPIVVLEPTGVTEIPIEELFVTLPESEAWTYEVVDAGSPELNLSLDEQTLVVKPTTTEVDIEQIAIRATNGDGESIIQRPLLILDVPDPSTTQAIDNLLTEAGDVLKTLAQDADAQSSEDLANLVNNLNSLVEEQPRVFKFLVQPDTLLALGIEQPQVDAAYELIHSEVIGQELGLPDSLYEALKTAGSSAWERFLVEAHDLAELPTEGLLSLIGFIEFARQGHDRKTLQTFNAIHELDDEAYTVKYTNGADWAEKLTELVDQAIASGTPNAVVNLGLDLAQFDDLEHTTTRYELTPAEQQAIQYAQENNVLLVTAAGNTGDLMSALGAAAQKFDNILVVGAVDRWQEKADYSAQGEGLSLVAPGGEWETDPEAFVGTSKASAYVTAAVSLLWQANPELNYRQVKDILLKTADDLEAPGWDPETGAGLLDVAEAIILAQQTQATPVTEEIEPVSIEPFSGDGRVAPLARPASDSREPVIDFLNPSSDTRVDLWDTLLDSDDGADSSLAEQVSEGLDQYQKLKAEVDNLSMQERLLEESFALVEQQTQVEANRAFTLQNEYQTLTQELQSLSFQKFLLENQTAIYKAFTDGQSTSLQQKLQNAGIEVGEGSQGEFLAAKIIELENAIAREQLSLNKTDSGSPLWYGIRAERDAYNYELKAIQDLLTIDGVQKLQEIERINLELTQKQESFSDIEQDLANSQENLIQLDLQLETIPNELEAIRLAQEERQESLHSLLEMGGFSLPYRERIDAIQRQVAYLEKRFDETGDEDKNIQNAVSKEVEWTKAHLSVLESSASFGVFSSELDHLIKDLKEYQNSDTSNDLPTQEYIDYLEEIIRDQQDFLRSKNDIAQKKQFAEFTHMSAEQALQNLWDEHIQLTLDKAQLKDLLSYPNLEFWYPAQYKAYKHALSLTDSRLNEKYQAIRLTERYVEQVKVFANNLQNWETFLIQVDGEIQIHEQKAEQWEIQNQAQRDISQGLLESLSEADALQLLLLELEYLSSQNELLKTTTQLETQQSLLEELLAQDELLKEEQSYYYNLAVQHEANTWAYGFYSASEAASALENHQEAALIADQRNKLWVQIQAALVLLDYLETRKEEQGLAVKQATQDIQAAGQEVPVYADEKELQEQLARTLAQLNPFFSQLKNQISTLESAITASKDQWASLQDATQLRAEATRKLIAFGVTAAESDPEFFYTTIEPQVETFISELQQHYQLLNESKEGLSQIVDKLSVAGLSQAIEDFEFVEDHIQELEVWQGDTAATVGDLRGLLNDAWDSLSILRQQQNLDNQLKAPRLELVTSEAAETALSTQSIQGNAQLHDQVADDLVGAVKEWTQELQTSHQITQDLITAQSSQSQSVDELLTVIQDSLTEPFSQYRLAKVGLRDTITTQQAISDRSLGFEQAIEDSQNRIEELELKLVQGQELWEELSALNYAPLFSTNPVVDHKQWSESRRSYYSSRLAGAENSRRTLEAQLDPSNPTSLHSLLYGYGKEPVTVDLPLGGSITLPGLYTWEVKGVLTRMEEALAESKNWRKNNKIPLEENLRPEDRHPYWVLTKKKKFLGIKISESKEDLIDFALLRWRDLNREKVRLESEITQTQSNLKLWKDKESEYSKLEKQWIEADNAASQAEWQAKQVRNTLAQLKDKTDYESPKFQEDLQREQNILITLEQQTLEAQQEAQSIQSSLEQAWEAYVVESQEYREASVDVFDEQSKISRQALQYRSMLAEVERWVESQTVSTNNELLEAQSIQAKLNAAIEAVQGEITNAVPKELTELTTREAQLKEALALLLSKINVLEERRNSLTQKRTLIAASDAVIVAEEKLLQATFANPDQDNTVLEAELNAAREALAEAQRLAEQAEASSQALTQPLMDLKDELLARNDEHILQARQQQQVLEELREATELNLNYTLKATEAQQRVNAIETQIITQLQQAVDAGNQEAISLLKVAETNDRAALAELYYLDYGDLASDKKFAKPEYRQLADQYYQEWQRLSQVKDQEKQQADYWNQLRQKAEKELAKLQGEDGNGGELADARADLDYANSLVAETQEEIEAKEQALAIAQIRVDSIEQIRAETERTFIQLASLDQLNLAQAQLEVQIAEKRDADIEQSIQDRLAREQQAIDRKRKVVLAQLEQLKQIQSEADLQQTLNEIRGELGMTDLDIVESPVQLQTQMADLLGQLDVLEVEEPDLPEDLKALLTEVKGDIHLALQGEEAANIQTNLLAVADGMVQQIEQYKAELAQIDLESQQEDQLLQLTQTNLQEAAQQFVEAAEQNQELRDQIDDLNIEYWVALQGIAYAEQQVEISEQWAEQARAALEQTIAKRKEARKQRRKAFWNKILSGLSTVVSIIGAVVSFVPGLQLVGVGLIAAAAGINAIQSAINGDWLGAVFSGVMAAASAVTAGAGNLIGQVAVRAIQGAQAAASGAFNSARSIKSGNGVLGALQIIGGVAGAASQGLQSVFSQLSTTGSKVMQSVLNGLQQAPQMIYSGIDAIKNGDWFAAVQNFFNGAVSLGKSLGSFFNDATNEALKYVDKVGSTGLALAGAIKKGGINAWLSGIDSLLGTWEEEIQGGVDAIDKRIEERQLDKEAEEILKEAEHLSGEAKTKYLSNRLENLSSDVGGSVIGKIETLEEQTQVLSQVSTDKQADIVHELPEETKKDWAKKLFKARLSEEVEQQSDNNSDSSNDSGTVDEGSGSFNDDEAIVLPTVLVSATALTPFDEAIEFVAGALAGEFNRDPSVAQILLGAAVEMMPGTGVPAAIRDISAISERFITNSEEMKKAENWIGMGSAVLSAVPFVPGSSLRKLFQKVEVDALRGAIRESDDVVEKLVVTAQRPARSGSNDSKAIQALKKKVDRANAGKGNKAFQNLPKTQESAEKIMKEVLTKSNENPIVKTGVNRSGKAYTDVFNPKTGRGVRVIEGEFDTFVNLD